MAIVRCSKCGKEYNSILPVCPSCGLDVSMSEVIDENGSLLDGTGGKDFKIIHRLNATFGNDVTIFKKDSRTYGVAQSICDIILPQMNYTRYSYIDEIVTKGFLRVNSYIDGIKKWGIINVNGEIVLPLIYDNIWRLKPQFIDITRIEKDGKHYIVNLEDKTSVKILKLMNGENKTMVNTNFETQDSNDIDLLDDVCRVFNGPYHNDALDIDQQSPEFWNSL